MRLFAPRYYEQFKCIADRCRHSCCVGWEIDVDADTLAYYQALEGEIGTRIRAGLAQGEEGAYFAMCEGRCPNLDEKGLCRIISALGEEALCDICREHPRFYNEVGEDLEVGLGAACEAAAALILAADDYASFVLLEGEAQESPLTVCDFEAREWRARLYEKLNDARFPYEQRLARVAQGFGGKTALDGAECAALFGALEYLDGAHRTLFLTPFATVCPDGLAPKAERFLAYLVYRHASGAQNESDFRTAVGMATLLERLFVTLVAKCGLSPEESARIISEEIEYSEDNTDAIRRALASPRV